MQKRLNAGNLQWGIGGHACPGNPRQQYRLMQREQIEASLVMAKQFPGLKRLTVALEYYHANGATRHGSMKCTLNVEHARSVLWFACPAVDCVGGDFDLSAALAKAVAGRRRVATGELRCPGARRRGAHERVPCQALLRYKLTLNYD